MIWRLHRSPTASSCPFAPHATRSAAIVGFAALLLAPIVTASEYVVGPGGDYDDLQDAITFSADGDTLLVDASIVANEPLLQNKSLRIIGHNGKPRIRAMKVRDLTPTKRVTFSNIEFVPHATQSIGGLDIRSSAGLVFAQHCEVVDDQGDAASAGFVILGSSAVVLSHCTGQGGEIWPGLDVAQASVWVHHSTMSGGEGIPGFLAGSGLRANASTVRLFDTTLIGGNGQPNASGASAVLLQNNALVTYQGGSLVPGVHGPNIISPPPPAISGTGTATAVTCTPVELEIVPVAVEGTSPTLAVRAKPGSQVLMILGLQQLPFASNSILGALVVNPLVVTNLSTIPISGTLAFPAPLPFLDSEYSAFTIDFQMLVAPPSEKLALSNPAALTILASFP